MKIFNIAGDFESEQDALEWGRGFVFSECESTDQDKPSHSRYVCEVQPNVALHYDFAGDYYFFEDLEQGEQSC